MSNRFDDQPVIRSGAADIDVGLRSYMQRVYNYMALGLGLTGFIAYWTSTQTALMQGIFMSPMKWVVMFAPLGIVFFLSARIGSMQSSTARTLFFVYAGLLGLSLSSIFWVFKAVSIAQIFFISASTFAAMSLYGYTTRKDLSQFGSFLFMGLIGVVIASLVNLFLQNSMMQLVISAVAVLVFVGLTAYDTQMIKETYLESDSVEVANKKAVFGALQLYMDFINLFIHLLHLFGDRK